MSLDPGRGSGGNFIKACEVAFKRFVLYIFRLMGGFKKKRMELDPAMIKKILFICHYKLGDMIISLPVFHNLKRTYPEIRIDLLCSKDNYHIVQTDPNIANIYRYRKQPLSDFDKMIQLRNENYDCVVDLTFGESVTAAIQVSMIASDGYKYGVDKRSYARYYDKTVEQNESDSHVSIIMGRALNLFGIESDNCDMKPHIFLSDEIKENGRRFSSGLRQGYGRLIGVNLSVGNPGRVWPIENYIKLINNILSMYKDSVIVLSYAPSDKWKIDRILVEFKEKVVPIPSGLNIIQVAGLLSYLDYLITPDTSIYHFASALNIPSIVLFSGHDKNYVRWGPYSSGIIPVRSKEIDSIKSISPDDVFQTFNKLVDDNMGNG